MTDFMGQSDRLWLYRSYDLGSSLNQSCNPFVALLFAYLQIGANIVGTTTDVPSEFVMVIQAIIILLVAATLFMESLRKRAVIKLSKVEGEVK